MEVITRDLLSLVMAITMDMDNLMSTRIVIIIMDLMDMRLSMITRRDLLRLDMATEVIATSMSTGLTLITRLRFIIHRHITMDMARGLLSLVMALHMFMLSRRTMDMATPSLMNMDTTFLRGLLNLVMVITMDMDNLMSTRTVIIIMDLMDMRLSMITRRDLLRLDIAMGVIATSMSTDPTLITRLRFIIHRHITMDMARGLLSLVMALLMFMLSRRTMDMATQSLMNMDTTFIKDQLDQDMVMAMDMALLMSMLSRRIMDMATLNLMNMDTTSIRDLLNLDMDPMKVTKRFPTLLTPIMISKCTTLTKQMEIVPHFHIRAINL